MAEDRMAVLETVRKAIADGDVDFLRDGLRVLAIVVSRDDPVEGDVVAVSRGCDDPDELRLDRPCHGPHTHKTRGATQV